MSSIKSLIEIFLITLLIVLCIMLVANVVIVNMPWYIDSYDSETRIESVRSALLNGSRQILIANMGPKELSYTITHVIDEPRLFWVASSYKMLKIGGMYLVLVGEKYEDVEACQNQIDEIVNSVLTDIINDDMSDCDKTKAIHDWICENITYGTCDNNSDQDIYGALVLKKAVCSGYAKAFAYLLNKAGVKSSVISGTALNSSGVYGPHAWVMAQVDGNQYYFDVTWDDQGEYAVYDWFCVEEEDFQKTHQPEIYFN